MPELPEVEVVRLGLAPHLKQQKIADVIIRHPRLRLPIPLELKTLLRGTMVLDLSRRGKYLLFRTQVGTIIWHLGMSGSLRMLSKAQPPKKHDHVDLIFTNRACLRFNDPRRFGLLLFTKTDPLEHPLLAELGPEPLSAAFNATYLWKKAQKRKVAIKIFIMNSKMVVGVGNIYAAEALFRAKIHPLTPAQRLSREQFKVLCAAIKSILKKAIKQGGTTLKDFVKTDGKPGYFKQRLQVYGRAGQACLLCQTRLEQLRLGQRATVFCPVCQGGGI